MHLRVVTPTRQMVDAEVSEVTAPGIVGEFGVLRAHATFLGALDVGCLSYVERGERRTVLVYRGYAEVAEDVVTVLADDAEFPEEIDSAEAKSELVRLDKELAKDGQTTTEVARLLAERRKAEIRVAAASV